MITVLVDPAALAAPRLDLVGPTYQHLFRSRRLDQDARLRLVDGQGQVRAGRIAKIATTRATIEIEAETPGLAVHGPSLDLTLLIGALRPERASWLVEKATELGVRRIVFLNTERTPRAYGQGRLERLERVAVAALEQSHGVYMPKIEGVLPWPELESRAVGKRFVLLPSALGRADPSPRGGAATVLIGPEGGFSNLELDQLEALDFRAIQLGPQVLRVETAALAAATLLLLRFGIADSSMIEG
jgi:16S rRNA (uracil1498-N3)-methyltransferase